MALTEAELAYLRAEVGEEWDEGDLDERHDRLGNAHDVALEVVRQRLAQVLHSGPSAYNVTGVYSEDNTATIRGLQAQLTRLAQQRMDANDGSADVGGRTELARARLVRRRHR